MNKHIIFWKYYVFCKFRYIKFDRYRLRACFQFNPNRVEQEGLDDYEDSLQLYLELEWSENDNN